MDDLTDVKAREKALRIAMLAGDVGAPSDLIEDSFVLTGPDGCVRSKADDLAAHASGLFRLQTLDVLEAQAHRVGDTVVMTTWANVAGFIGENEVSGLSAIADTQYERCCAMHE